MKSAPSPQSRSWVKHKLRLTLPTAALLFGALVLATRADPGQDNRAPDVPAPLQVPDGNKVSAHAYAVGVQIYVATASPTDPTQFIWVFRAPEAVLFADNGGNGEIGIHYAGPTWESESGSKVVGRVLTNAPAANTIPWLLLEARSTEGPGILERTTYIQRVNTTGGRAPAAAPTQSGQEARVPYTAEYFFYRASQH